MEPKPVTRTTSNERIVAPTRWPSLPGVAAPEQARFANDIFARFRILLVVTSDEDRSEVEAALDTASLSYATEVYSLADIDAQLKELGGAVA